MDTDDWKIIEKTKEFILLRRISSQGEWFARKWNNGVVEFKLNDACAKSMGYPNVEKMLKSGFRDLFLSKYNGIPEWVMVTESGIEIYENSMPKSIKEIIHDTIINQSQITSEDKDYIFYNCTYMDKSLFVYLDKRNQQIFYDADDMVKILNLGENFESRISEDIVLDSITEWKNKNSNSKFQGEEGLFFKKDIGGKTRWIGKL